jgi:hypothetical protein
MFKFSAALLLCCLVHIVANAQVQPAEGRVLHYRMIGFSFPQPATGKYLLEIASGNDTTTEAFEEHIIKSTEAKTNRVVAEVPSFGSEYTWRVVNKANNAKGCLHHFSTLKVPQLDPATARFRLITNEHKYNDAYVFVDATRCMYNMAGLPVWYLPNIPGFVTETAQVRDMKLTPQGTITLLVGENAMEVNYDAEVLWYMPKDKKPRNLEDANHYHHEFTRLRNGHYMVLGNETVWYKTPMPEDNSLYEIAQKDMKPDPGHKMYGSTLFGTVLEYDKDGKVVWSWKASKHFDIASLYYRKIPNGLVNLDLHQNAFFFDEQNKNIYISFKPISQVVKVKYPAGNIVATYGRSYEFNGHLDGEGFFCEQHSCKRSQEGYLYLFNNNLCDTTGLPTILMMKEPASSKQHMEKVWEFECPVEEAQKVQLKRFDKSHFGNVEELPNHDIFASICSPYGNVFIVNRAKQVLWNAVSEKWNESEKKWDIVPTYRASIITSQKGLERLIWAKKTK